MNEELRAAVYKTIQYAEDAEAAAILRAEASAAQLAREDPFAKVAPTSRPTASTHVTLPTGNSAAAGKLSPPRKLAWETLAASRKSRSPPPMSRVTLTLDVDGTRAPLP